MSEISEAIQEKCLAFSDRIIKLNDYLLEQAASKRYDGGSKRYDVRKGKSAFSHQTSNISQPSYVLPLTSRVPVHLQSVAALANQLLRSGRFSSTAEGKVNEYRRKTTSGAARAE